MAQTFLYKAAGDRGKRAIFLVPSEGPRTPPVATLPDGTQITAKYVNTNEGRHQFMFPTSILGLKGIKVSYNGSDGVIPDGSLSYEGSGLGDLKYRAKGDLAGAGGGGNGLPIGGGGSLTPGGFDNAGNPIPQTVDASSLAAGQSNVPLPNLPPYVPISPQAFNQQYAQYNRGELAQNFVDSQNAALGLIGTESAGNRQFTPDAAALQQGIASQENAFNRGEVAASNAFNPSQIAAANTSNRVAFNESIDASGLPIRSTVAERLDASNRMAKGFLPTTMEDRAFEMTARSAASDSLQARGLGTSSFTQNAIDKYTIGERLKLMEQGNNDVDRWLSKGAALLIDSPIKYNPLLNQPNTGRVSQDVRGLPSLSGSQLAGSQFSERNNLTTIAPTNALGVAVGQQQYGYGQTVDQAQFNYTGAVQQGQFNIANNLNVDLAKLTADANTAALTLAYATNAAKRAAAEHLAQRGVQADSAGFGNNAGKTTTTTVVNGNQASGSTY